MTAPSDNNRRDQTPACATGEHLRLTRDLTAARERIKRLEEERDAALAVATDPHALWANWLRGTVTLPAGIGDVRQYQERITRLEEAGDELFDDVNALRFVLNHRGIYGTMGNSSRAAWTAAKEAKP
jgi:uncharacterized protein (UPF0335 family)